MSGAWRQEWAQAVRAQADLSMTARMLAQVLALDFANASTGQCNPSRQTLADHLGVSEATIKRALADLTAAGWLGRTALTARNRTVSYTFLSPGKVVAFAPVTTANAGQKRPAIGAGTRVKSAPNAGQICTSPIIRQEPSKNQTGARGGDAGRIEEDQPAPRPVPGRVIAQSDQPGIAAWERWLSAQGLPPLANVTDICREGELVGYRVPSKHPPCPSRSEDTQAALAFFGASVPADGSTGARATA